LSFQINEAINFANKYWIPYGKSAKQCTCGWGWFEFNLWFLRGHYHHNTFFPLVRNSFWHHKRNKQNIFGTLCPEASRQHLWCRCPPPLLQWNHWPFLLYLEMWHHNCFSVEGIR
jgi:hypothetical protein